MIPLTLILSRKGRGNNKRQGLVFIRLRQASADESAPCFWFAFGEPGSGADRSSD